MRSRSPFILVLEDDQALRDSLATVLQAEGYTVLKAGTFKEGLDRASIKPDLVIMDIRLPDASGWEFARWMQSIAPSVPLVVMSGVAEPTREQYQRYSIKGFLAKPFGIGQLLGIVQEHVAIPATTVPQPVEQPTQTEKAQQHKAHDISR